MKLTSVFAPPHSMKPVLPAEYEAPDEILALSESGCGVLAAWQVLSYFGRSAPVEAIVRGCRFDPDVGTYAVGLALCLAEFGLCVEFSTDPDPSPTATECELYPLAIRAGVTISAGATLDELASRLDGSTVAILLYQDGDTADSAHLSPLVEVTAHEAFLPNEGSAFGLADLEERRLYPGVFRQCVIASAYRCDGSTVGPRD